MAAPEYIVNDPSRLAIFHDARDKIVMDPLDYGRWFAAADERRRRLAVGARRYATVKAMVKEPRYEHFVSSKTGELLPLAVLKREGEERREGRAGRVRDIMTKRTQDLANLAAYGFLSVSPQAKQAPSAARTRA